MAVDGASSFRPLRFWPLLAVLLLSTAAPAATYHVATTGDDDAAGTAAQPWRTIDRAAHAMHAGDTVIIAGGAYRESVEIVHRSGSPQAPITYRAAAGETVAIDAAGLPLGIRIAASHIVLDGLEVRNAAGFGVAVRSAQSDVAIRNCVVHHNGRTGIRTFGADGVRVEQCLVYRNGGDGIEVLGSTAELRIRSCTIWGNGSDGVRSVFGTVEVDDALIVENDAWGIDAIGDGTVSARYSDLWHNASGDLTPDAVIVDPTVIRVDPLLRDPARGDFHLGSNSPARGSGSDGGDMGYRFADDVPPSEGFTAGSAGGWNVGVPDVLLQTIYGTAQDGDGTITANTPVALSIGKGVGVAFAVPRDTALDALRMKLQNLKPEVGLRVRLYDVTGENLLKAGAAPSRREPGGAANVALFERSYYTPGAVPYHLEPSVSPTVTYSDLLVDFGPLEVRAGEYLLVLDNLGPSNTIGSIVVGDEIESRAMGEYPDGRPLPGGVQAATEQSVGNVRYYKLASTADDHYTAAARVPAMQLTSTVVNHAPVVRAGGDRRVVLPETAVQLDGTVSDDGQPDPPGAVAIAWTKQSGPGTVQFADPTSPRTTATFSAFGVYVLRLTADDGELVSSDDVTIAWLEALPPNHPPVVDAGSDQDISLPRSAVVDADVSDDGEPEPPGAVATTWSASGPGAVHFDDPHALRTGVGFSEPGTYVLRLTADDGQDSAFDELTIVVRPFGSYEGYGAAATGGAGGRVVTVTSLADSGPGTFREAVDSLDGTPTVITFAVAGEIFVTGEIRIARNNVTVMGSSAPDPGITLNGAFTDRNLGIKASNVIVENLRIRNAALENIVLWGGRDIVVDHCSLTWSGDGALDINGTAYGAGVNHVTVSRSLVAGAVEVSRSRGHRISWQYNLFTNNNRRQPKIFEAGPDYNFICNYVRQWGNTAINIQSAAQVNIINNFFGPPYPAEHWADACYLSGGTRPADVYTAGNAHAAPAPGQAGRGPYDVNKVGAASAPFEIEAPPVAVTIIPADEVPANVIADVGAQPRDAHDEAFINTYTGPGRETGGDPP